ncbi:unnamed protein product [Effrenium voratum]|uniref:Uncharacterized protein n=1 Tax=Effrenium voratum TaxID=2562239 RepID=A0AA36J1Y3_9DINO|nr:unnamed protein product [Effrenium voratum]
MLLDEDFTTVDADLIFAKVKGRGSRKIDFGTFKKALSEVAKKWNNMTQEQVEDIICLAAGPHYETSQVDPVADEAHGPARFYYDMTLYTGTHKYGGPSMHGNGIVDGAPSNFQEHVNRDREGEVAATAERRRRALAEAEENQRLGKSRSPGPHRRESRAQVRRPVSSLKGPERFFYDKNSYTGTHKHGGPSVTGNGLPKQGYEDLSELVRRDHVQDDELHRHRRTQEEPIEEERPDYAPRTEYAPRAEYVPPRPEDLPMLLGSPRRRRQQVEVKAASPKYTEYKETPWVMPASPPVAHKVMRTESGTMTSLGGSLGGTWMPAKIQTQPVMSPVLSPQVQHRPITVPRTVQSPVSPSWYTQPFVQQAPVMWPTAMR